MPEITRISTLSIHTTAISNFSKVQGDLANLQDQLSSGKKGRTFEAYNGQVEQYTGLEKEVKRLKMYLDNNAETVSRLKITEDSLTEMIELADSVENLMTAKRNPATGDDIAFTQQIKALRLSLAKELNVNVEGRYLFGGTRTDLPPVLDEPVPEAIDPGVPDDGYYQGAKDNVVTRVQDNVDIEYDVRADDPAFQKLLSAMSLGLEADAEDSDDKIAEALTQTQDALEGIIALRAKIQTKRTDVERIVTRQTDTKSYLTGVVKSIAEVDQVDAASKVAIDQATLTATFQVFARISSLRLSDFLN
jgi:flagellar hook-associated protein 3 FlgL